MTVFASRPCEGKTFQEEKSVPPFVTGIMLHNALPVFTESELETLNRGVVLYDPATERVTGRMGAGGDNGWTARALAFERDKESGFLWIGTLFDGAYKVELPSGEVLEHLTVMSTGIPGRALKLGRDFLVFEPDSEPGGEELSRLDTMLGTGLYIRINTEVFRVKEIEWPRLTVYTYGSHRPSHSGATGPGGMDRVVIMTGFPDDTVNDVLVDGDTVWYATGLLQDKGLAGGVVFYRKGEMGNRQPEAVFNEVGRFHWHRSNACLTLEKSGGRLWSGWAEIRGLKPWGGVSGNLLNFRGDGVVKEQWQDFTRPIGVDHEGWAPVLHVTVTDLAAVNISTGDTVESCMAAATFSVNNPHAGMGAPGRRARGGNGLRVMCAHMLRALAAKRYDHDGKPADGAPSSNAVYAIESMTGRGKAGSYIVAATDAGLYFVEMNSRWRDYFYQPPSSPQPAVNIGSHFVRGVRRTGEVLHGMTVGGESWPPCLPDTMVQSLYLEQGPGDTVTIWAGTFNGLARYAGPVSGEALSDCSRWKTLLKGEDGRPLPVADIEPVLIEGRKRLALAISDKWPPVLQGEAIRRLMERSEKRFRNRPLTHVRTHYSTFYENAHESLIFPDASAINLYTPAFHRKQCGISRPGCLEGDTALNWEHFDRMTDAIVKQGLSPALCVISIPELVYRSFVAEGPCKPPRGDDPRCSPAAAANAGSPWDWTRWENLVFAMVDRLYSRYGRERVSEWMLEVWNEPAIHWNWPWQETYIEDYAIMFKHTLSAIQACNRRHDLKTKVKGGSIKAAGPTWHGDPKPPGQDFESALQALKEREAAPDILTGHIYPIQSMDMSPFYNKYVEIADGLGLHKPIGITEYNLLMVQPHDGAGTSASSEIPALFRMKSLQGLYRSERPPHMMYFTDIQALFTGARSNWAGLAAYVGTRGVAPRPGFNSILLAAQAGELPLDTRTEGLVQGFGRYDPYTGRIMIILYSTGLKKPWRETINYSSRDELEFELEIRDLPESVYRIREFRIDSGHSNYLTALWRVGSFDQPGPREAERITRESELRPLPGHEQSLPSLIKGNSVKARLRMQEESIMAFELEPPPVMAASRDGIEGLEITAGDEDNLTIKWTGDGKSYGKIYDAGKKEWGPVFPIEEDVSSAEEERQGAVECRTASGIAGSFFARLEAGDGSGRLDLNFGDPASGYKAFPVADRRTGGGAGCFIDRKRTAHVVFVEGDTVMYRSAAAVKDLDGAWSLLARGARPVDPGSLYPPVHPRSPAVAVDAQGRVHVAWIEDDPLRFGMEGREVLRYTWFR